MCWRRVLEVFAGLAIGAVCLVAWSGTSSAAETPPPPPPPLSLAGLTGQVLAPVQDLTGALGLAPAVDPLVTQVVAPTVAAVDQVVAPTVATVDGIVGTVTAPIVSLPGVPPLPGVPSVPGSGQPQVPAMPLPGPGASPGIVPAGVVSSGGGVETTASTTPTLLTVSDGAVSALAVDGALAAASRAASAVIDAIAAPLSAGRESLPAGGGSFLPVVALGAAGSALSGASGAIDLALMAVLAGVVVVATTPAWRRVPVPGMLTPRAMAYAIATPPG